MNTITITWIPEALSVKNTLTYQEFIGLVEELFWYEDVIWPKTLKKMDISYEQYKKWDFIDWDEIYKKIMSN